MAKQARQARMILGAVLKLSVIETFWKLHLLLWGLGVGCISGRHVSRRIDDGDGENDRDD